MPKRITAGTGLDAFAHCVEALCSPHYHPMSHGIALEGLRLVKEFLAVFQAFAIMWMGSVKALRFCAA